MRAEAQRLNVRYSTDDLRARAEWLEGHLAEHDDLHGHEAQSATPDMLRSAANEIDRLRGLINPTPPAGYGCPACGPGKQAGPYCPAHSWHDRS